MKTIDKITFANKKWDPKLKVESLYRSINIVYNLILLNWNYSD